MICAWRAPGSGVDAARARSQRHHRLSGRRLPQCSRPLSVVSILHSSRSRTTEAAARPAAVPSAMRPQRGRRPCSALGLLATLEEDLQEQDRIIDRGIEFDFEVEALHRAARKHMYRTYVAARFGYLGRGIRVRLPDCVVAAIRSRYRIPTCECSLDAIVSCDCGYSGFKEA